MVKTIEDTKEAAIEICRKISKGYWPDRSNSSADIASGNAVVDSLSVGELAVFFRHIATGPTYVLTRRHCDSYPFSFDLLDKSRECKELIDQFLVEMENRKTQLVNSLLKVS